MLMMWLSEIVNPTEKPLSLDVKVTEFIKDLFRKLEQRAFTPDRASEYFLKPWEQEFIHEVIWQKAIDWLQNNINKKDNISSRMPVNPIAKNHSYINKSRTNCDFEETGHKWGWCIHTDSDYFD